MALHVHLYLLCILSAISIFARGAYGVRVYFDDESGSPSLCTQEEREDIRLMLKKAQEYAKEAAKHFIINPQDLDNPVPEPFRTYLGYVNTPPWNAEQLQTERQRWELFQSMLHRIGNFEKEENPSSPQAQKPTQSSTNGNHVVPGTLAIERCPKPNIDITEYNNYCMGSEVVVTETRNPERGVMAICPGFFGLGKAQGKKDLILGAGRLKPLAELQTEVDIDQDPGKSTKLYYCNAVLPTKV